MKLNKIKNIKLTYPILIEGLPGIGNVGKIAVDFMIDSLNAKKIYEVHSDKFPHAVFVNENNLVELPSIEVFHKKINGNDLLLLAGDIQPIDESSCYSFCNEILNLFEEIKGKEIITLGGIGLQKIPENPQVYCTGNSKKIIDKYSSKMLNQDIYGVVGPIVGVSGLLVGLAKKRNIDSIAMLAETFGHPSYLGIKGAKEILKILNKKLNLKINLDQLESEISQIEHEIKKKVKDISKLTTKEKDNDINYFG